MNPNLPPLFEDNNINEIVDAIHHYYRRMSPRMDYAEKKSLLHEMSNYMRAHGIKSDTMIEALPCMKPYWKKDVLSNHEFVMIADCLAYDVFEDDEGEDY